MTSEIMQYEYRNTTANKSKVRDEKRTNVMNAVFSDRARKNCRNLIVALSVMVFALTAIVAGAADSLIYAGVEQEDAEYAQIQTAALQTEETEASAVSEEVPNVSTEEAETARKHALLKSCPTRSILSAAEEIGSYGTVRDAFLCTEIIDTYKMMDIRNSLVMSTSMFETTEQYEEVVALLADGEASETRGASAEAEKEEPAKSSSKFVEEYKSEALKSIPAGELECTTNSKFQIELTDAELEAMLRIVEAEAGDQDLYGRILVANVVLNRMYSKNFANSVEGVIFERGQFSPIRDGSYYRAKVSKKTRQAVKHCLAGEDYSQGALYFFMRSGTTAQKAAWFDNSLKRLFRYGCHEFYR